jgi:hypothetical protein
VGSRRPEERPRPDRVPPLLQGGEERRVVG